MHTHTHTHTDMQGNTMMTCRVWIYIHSCCNSMLIALSKEKRKVTGAQPHKTDQRTTIIYAVPFRWVLAEKEKVLGF